MNAWILRVVGVALVATAGCSGDLRRASPCFAWAESVCKTADRCGVVTSAGSDIESCIDGLSDRCSEDYDEDSLTNVEECIEPLDEAECYSATSTLVGYSCQSVVSYGFRVYNPDGTEVTRPFEPQPPSPPFEPEPDPELPPFFAP